MGEGTVAGVCAEKGIFHVDRGSHRISSKMTDRYLVKGKSNGIMDELVRQSISPWRRYMNYIFFDDL